MEEMTPKQAKKLRKAIKELVNAKVNLSWRGAGPVEEFEGLKFACKNAKHRVNRLIDNYTELDSPW